MKRLPMLFILLLTAALIVSVNTACDRSKEIPAPKQQQQKVTGPLTQDIRPNITGKVVETMNSGGYTYVKLEKDGVETWVAVTEIEGVKVGDEMSFYAGDVMPNFKSNTLNRTFESIIFSPGPVGQQGDPFHSQFMSRGAVVPEPQKVEVEKATGDNAYTIAELYEKSADLDQQTVTVRGIVVKVSTGIMGTNFIHIQDGSGDPSVGSHNLVVTSDAVPLEGEVITVSGTLTKDKDFGAGYFYAVILENSTVSK
jgi:hypothetical protein